MAPREEVTCQVLGLEGGFQRREPVRREERNLTREKEEASYWGTQAGIRGWEETKKEKPST